MVGVMISSLSPADFSVAVHPESATPLVRGHHKYSVATHSLIV